MSVVGVTHSEFDLDGGSCLKLLERLGSIQSKIFGEEELEIALARSNIQKLICVDYAPEKQIPGVEVLVYAHHKNEEGDYQKDAQTEKTSFDILVESIGKCALDDEKFDMWRKVVTMGDKKMSGEPMSITQALSKVHYLMNNDAQVYDEWFSPLFDSFFVNDPNPARAIKILQEEISSFITVDPTTPAKFILERWMERSRNLEKLLRGSRSNFVHFLACMEGDEAQQWMNKIIQGLHQWQVDFFEAKAQFSRAKPDFYGNTLIISGITKSRQFKPAVSSKIYSKDEDVDPLIREKIKDKSSPWLLVIVNPTNKNFQIFVNGNKEVMHDIIGEVVKAIRAEILLKRDKPVDFSTLSDEGVIAGTAPLFFNKMVSFPSILWGSIKYEKKEVPIEFGNTSVEIHRRLNEIIKLALDENEYVSGCNPRECQNCSIYSWQLKKCANKEI